MVIGTPSAKARELVRRHVARNQLAQIKILRGDVGAMDPDTLEVGGLSSPETVYSGKARIHTVSGQGSIETGEGEIDQRALVVSIPWNAPMPRRDDVVVVDQDTLSDLDLTGQTLRVLEVSGGTLFGDARRLSCTTWGKSRYWTGGS